MIDSKENYKFDLGVKGGKKKIISFVLERKCSAYASKHEKKSVYFKAWD